MVEPSGDGLADHDRGGALQRPSLPGGRAGTDMLWSWRLVTSEGDVRPWRVTCNPGQGDIPSVSG
jgi:hypothetical protein